jgi:hypothetical protein
MKNLFKGRENLEGEYTLEIYSNYLIIEDPKGNLVYYENSNGFWWKREFDEQGNEIYYESSYGNWSKSEYDDRGNEIYYEDSDGTVVDDRPKRKVTIELTEDQLKKIKESGLL